MTNQRSAQLGLGLLPGPSSSVGAPHVHVTPDLSRYPDAVAEGMRRELQRLDFARIAAFADGRRIWTPRGSFMIGIDGQPSRCISSAADFHARAQHAAVRMESRTGYSFNRAFAQRYLTKEEPINA